MKALSQAMPNNVSAGIGNLKVIAFSGLKDETHWVHMEIFEGSYGGRLGKDGMDAVDTLYANTRNNPIEDIETHLPLRVLRYELREDVAGAGKWRGGLGSVRGFEQGTLGPRDVTGSAIGGPKKVTLNAELIAPFPGAGNDRTLRVFGFVDVGNAFGENDKINVSQLRASTGIGLSWISPVGPLRIAIANPVRKFAGDRIQKLQFQIGTAF